MNTSSSGSSRWHYDCCGFVLASEIELPHGRAGTGAATAWVGFRSVAADLGAGGRRGFMAHAQPGRFWFQVEGVARFLIRDGREIHIDPAPGADADSLRAFLLSTALAALLLQRGFMVLNGGAATRAGQTVALIGTAGVGRSTVLASLQREGWSLLSDDICAVKADADGGIAAWPAYPSLALWRDTLDRHGLPWASMRALRPCLGKYALPFANAATAPALLTHVVELEQTNKVFSRATISGVKRVVPLLEHTCLTRFLGGMSVRDRHLGLAAALTRQAEFFRVSRMRDGVDEAAFFDLVLACLNP